MLVHIRTWRRRHMLMPATGGVSEAKAMTGDVGAVSDGRHNRLRVSAASPACWAMGPNIESIYRKRYARATYCFPRGSSCVPYTYALVSYYCAQCTVVSRIRTHGCLEFTGQKLGLDAYTKKGGHLHRDECLLRRLRYVKVQECHYKAAA